MIDIKLVIVLPTYNEAENIQPLLLCLFGLALPGYQLCILVVDDDSPDGTAERVRTLQRQLPRLYLLCGPKRGLGYAYLRGMRYALDKLDADIVTQMDADFSHNPQDLPRLLTGLEQGADIAIGSRYVTGGQIPQSWSRWRRGLSWSGNRVARRLVGKSRVLDCTAGFRTIRSALLQVVLQQEIDLNGYAFQVALLQHAAFLKARIVEIPVCFIDRVAGRSKLGGADILEFSIYAADQGVRSVCSSVLRRLRSAPLAEAIELPARISKRE